MQVYWVVEFLEEKVENLKMGMVSTGRNIGTITQELQYPFAGSEVHFQQDSSFYANSCTENTYLIFLTIFFLHGDAKP